MRFFLLLLTGVVHAQQKQKQCLANIINGIPGTCFQAADHISKVNAIEADIRACKVQLGNCDGGGGGGGEVGSGNQFLKALYVTFGGKSMPYAITSRNQMGAIFEDLHQKALEFFEIDEDHDLTFDWAVPGGGVMVHNIKNDQDLEEALNMAAFIGTSLELTPHRTTLSPTGEPTEPWGIQRSVYQVYGNIADGRDAGPATHRSMKFKKTSALTYVRLHYEDNFRVFNNGGVCYWELYIDGARCPRGWVRGAMHSQGNDNNDHQTASVIGLCGGDTKKMSLGDHVFSVQVSGNGKDCYTGWDPESAGTFMMEVKEVQIGEHGYYATSLRGDVRGEDNMFPITNRIVTFTKKTPETHIRLLYYDNLRVYNGGHCRWYFKVREWAKDNWSKTWKLCGNNNFHIAQSIHTHGNENDHVPQAIAGYCMGGTDKTSMKITQDNKGQFQMAVGVNSGGHDCYTGWENSWHVEAEEVSLGKNAGRFVFQKSQSNADGRDKGFVNNRKLVFTKRDNDSLMRFFYSDNLRVHGHGKWCKWNIYVGKGSNPSDGEMKPLSPPISGARYVVQNQNDHTPGIIVGYSNMTAGEHTMKIFLKSLGDCYTGWDRQNQGNFMMEALEMPKAMIFNDINCRAGNDWTKPCKGYQ